MVSMTALSEYHASPESAARLKKRHRAERRLKLWGIAAIAIAGLALVALLWSVVGKATGALSEHYIALDVTIDAEKIDAADIGKGDFVGLTKSMLRGAFPDVKDRKEKRKLYDLISAGAAYDLRQHVIDAPDLVGQGTRFSFLASDVVDLYLKGTYGGLKAQDPTGTLALEPGRRSITVTSSAPDFAKALAAVKASLARNISRQATQLRLQQTGLRVFEERRAAAGATTPAEDLARLDAEIAARSAKIAAIEAAIDTLRNRAQTPDAAEKLTRNDPSILIRLAQGWIKLTELSPTGGKGVVIGTIGDDAVAGLTDWKFLISDQPEVSRKISDTQITWVESLREAGAIEKRANWRFLSTGDSREPELAGLWGAIVGSFWTMLVTFVISFPIGVLSAIYLEEFAPKNRVTDLIEVNINNLAAVPSIIFGLLGLSVIIGFFGVPRSAPLAGGMVLALMTLPTIIIAARASIAAVPPSIREAALGVGASQLQTAFHHVLPLAVPGILTGTIIGMARALGETAPLIMIGMVAFIVDIPKGITDSATVLPVQIFRWADFPERAFEARTAAAICVLLVFLIFMNALAVFLRKSFERRW